MGFHGAGHMQGQQIGHTGRFVSALDLDGVPGRCQNLVLPPRFNALEHHDVPESTPPPAPG